MMSRAFYNFTKNWECSRPDLYNPFLIRANSSGQVVFALDQGANAPVWFYDGSNFIKITDIRPTSPLDIADNGYVVIESYGNIYAWDTSQLFHVNMDSWVAAAAYINSRNELLISSHGSVGDNVLFVDNWTQQAGGPTISVPEPSIVLLLGSSGLVGLVGLGIKRLFKKA